MPQELIYTSAPTGLDRNAKGYCTVQRTKGMLRDVQSKLEDLSGLELGALRGVSRQQGVFQHVHLRSGLSTFSVISCLSAAGTDYSGRDNKLVHHFLLAASERPRSNPAAVAMSAPFLKTWHGQPQETRPPRLPAAAPASTSTAAWKRLTGDAGWAGHILKLITENPAAPLYLIVDDHVERLTLIAELLSLLPSSATWNVTFSTEFQSMPASVGCQLRFVSAGSPGARSAAAGRIACLDFKGGVPHDATGFVAAARNGDPVPSAAQSSSQQQPESRRTTPQQRRGPAGNTGSLAFPTSSERTPLRPKSFSQAANAAFANAAFDSDDDKHRTAAASSSLDTRTIAAQQAANRPPQDDSPQTVHMALIAASILGLLLVCGGGAVAWVRYQNHQAAEQRAFAEQQQHQQNQERLHQQARELTEDVVQMTLAVDQQWQQTQAPPAAAVDDQQKQVSDWMQQTVTVLNQAQQKSHSIPQQFAAIAEDMDESPRAENQSQLSESIAALQNSINRLQQTQDTISALHTENQAVRQIATQQQAQQFLARQVQPDGVQATTALLRRTQQTSSDSPWVASEHRRLTRSLRRVVRFAAPLSPGKLPQPLGNQRVAFPGIDGIDEIRITFPAGIQCETNAGQQFQVQFPIASPDGAGFSEPYLVSARVQHQNDIPIVHLTADDSFWQHPSSATLRLQVTGPQLREFYQFPDATVASSGFPLMTIAAAAELHLALSSASSVLFTGQRDTASILRLTPVAEHRAVAKQPEGNTPVPPLDQPIAAASNPNAGVRKIASESAAEQMESLFAEIEQSTSRWLNTFVVEGKLLTADSVESHVLQPLHTSLWDALVLRLLDPEEIRNLTERHMQLASVPKTEAQEYFRSFARRKGYLEESAQHLASQADLDDGHVAAVQESFRNWLDELQDLRDRRKGPAATPNTGAVPDKPDDASFSFAGANVGSDPFGQDTAIFDFEVRVLVAQRLLSDDHLKLRLQRLKQMIVAVEKGQLFMNEVSLEYPRGFTGQTLRRLRLPMPVRVVSKGSLQPVSVDSATTETAVDATSEIPNSN